MLFLHVFDSLMEILTALGTDFFDVAIVLVAEIDLLADFGHVVKYQLPLLASGSLHLVPRAASNPDAVLRKF